MTPLCWLVCVLVAADPADTARFAKPAMLARAEALVKPGAAARLVFLDARSRAAYQAGHIPGARWVDLDAWSQAVNNGDDRKAWERRIGGVGVDAGTPVVVYGASKPLESARLWWILRYWGIKDVRLLDGGFAAWQAAGGTADTAEPRPAPRMPTLKQEAGRLTILDELKREVESKKAGQIVDSRSREEHCGDKRLASRGGAIPGARHLDWSDTIDAKTGKFKSAPELARLFRAAGIDPNRPSTTYCQSGGRASVMAFALELLSGKPARNYYRSWSEWGNHPTAPVVTPPKK